MDDDVVVVVDAAAGLAPLGVVVFGEDFGVEGSQERGVGRSVGTLDDRESHPLLHEGVGLSAVPSSQLLTYN